MSGKSLFYVLATAVLLLFAVTFGYQHWDRLKDGTQRSVATSTLDIAQSTTSSARGKVPGGGDYWATRYSYPTFKFDSRWLTAARPDHDRMLARAPDGAARYANRGGNELPADRFTLLGPKPLDSGASAVAGRINAILSDPADDRIAYAGSDGGGVWKTSNCCDANTTWEVLTDDPMFNTIAIGTMHMDPNDNNIIYAGTGDLRYGSFSFGSSGLLRSKDAGASWEILGLDVFTPALPTTPGSFPQYQAIGQVHVDPRDSATIIVGTKTGLFISYDDGQNWDGPCLTNAFTSQRQDITSMLVRDTGTETELLVAVGTRGGPTPVQPDLDQNGANGIYAGSLPATGCPVDFELISRSDNGWPAGTGSGAADGPLGRLELARAPSNPDILYAEAVSPVNLAFLGVWRSDDGGGNWVQMAVPGNLTGCTPGGQSWYYAGISVAPTDPDQLFLSALNLFRSDDGGNSFPGATCNDNVHVDHHARAYVNNDPARLLIGTDGGVYYSANANAATAAEINYIQLNDTLPTIEFYSGDISADFAISNERAAAGGAQDNGSSVVTWSGPIEATNWTRVFGGDGIFARIEPVLGQRWYVESQTGNLGISQTGPFGPYQGVNEPWNADTRSFLFPFEIYKHDCPASTGCQHLIAGSNRVWETINGGINGADWLPNSPDLTKGVLNDRSFINQLAFSISDESIAIIGSNDGNVWFGFELGQGVADSATWVDVTDGNSVLPNRPILDVVTGAESQLVGYAAVGGFNQNTPATPGHVLRVECNADCSSFNWTDKSGNLPNIPINAIMVNPNNPAQVFAGSDWGLYFTDDIQQLAPEWSRFTAGLPAAMIWDIAVDRGFTALAVFTRSRGAYAVRLPERSEIMLIDGFE